MALPFNFSTTFIPGTACIGDSRVFINNNFSTLLSGISTLWFGAPLLSSNGISVLDNPLAIEVNSTAPALRIRQQGIGNAISVSNQSNPLGTLFAVNSTGQVVIGSLSAFNGEASLQIVSDSIGGFALPPNSDILLRLNSNTPNAADIMFEKARGTQTQMSSVSTNDFLGTLVFHGYDGIKFSPAASIAARVEGIPNLSTVPGGLVFSTRLSSNVVTNIAERMRITHDGKVGIGISTPTTIFEVSGIASATILSATTISATNIRTNIFDVTNTVRTSGFNTFNFDSVNGFVTNLTAFNFVTFNPVQYSTVSALLLSGDANFTNGRILSSNVDLLNLFINQIHFPTLTSTYTAVSPNSANWNTAYTVVCSNSASWLNTKTLNNYLSTSNIVLSTTQILRDLTVQGNVSASGLYRGNLRFISVSSNFVAVPDASYLVSTIVSGVTATLPTTPLEGDTIRFNDAFSTWSTRNFIISSNYKIAGDFAPLECNVSDTAFYITFTTPATGWRFFV